MKKRRKRYVGVRAWLEVFLLPSVWFGICAGAQTLPSPTPIQRSGDSEVRFNQGLIDLQDQKYKEAAAQFNDVLQNKSDDVEARYYLGLAQLNGEQIEQAIGSFTQVLAIQPEFNPARASRATALIQLRRLPEAQTDIAMLEQDEAFRGTASALQGRLYYEQGNFAKAAVEFERARSRGADLSSTSLYEGLSYLQLGNVQRSRRAFEQAAELQIDPSLAALSRQLQSYGAEGQSKPWRATLVAGYEYDSNVTLFDEGIVVPEDISTKDDGRTVLEPSGSYSFVNTRKLDIGISTSNYFSFQSTLTEFDVASYQVGAYANWQIADRLVAGLRYDFNSVELGYASYLKRNVVTGQLTLFEQNFGYTTVYGQFDRRQYESLAGTGSLDRDGPVYGFGVLQSINLPEFFPEAGSAEVQLAGRFQRQQTTGADFDGSMLDAGVTLIVPLPWKLKADVGARFGWERYDNVNSLDFTGDKRRDFETELSFGLTRQINKWVALRGEYSYTNHDSNVLTAPDPAGDAPNGINPYEFERHIVGLKMIVTF